MNKTDFFQQKPEPNMGDSKQKTLKDDCRLFSTIFTSCQSREVDLMAFFQHEIQSFSRQEDVPIFPFSVTLRLAPMPRFDRVSAFKLEDQYTSSTIYSHVSTTVSLRCCLQSFNKP
jgi:hypothetical protein